MLRRFRSRAVLPGKHHELGELREGDKVLIHAGAGSLGIMAIQLAKLKGAHVTATASAEKHPFVKSLC